MFERNIEDTIAYLRRETIGDAETITSRQIFASSIPPALGRMFEADIEALVTTEKERLLQSPRFRYEDDDVLALFDRIGDRAREHAVYEAPDYLAALEKNVKLLFNYVCRPQWTLVRYLFADREHASTDDILDALRVFWFYEYYPIILKEYFTQKGITVIHVRKFTELLERIDQEVVRSLDSRKTAHLTEPIYELFNIGSSAETLLAPIEALSIFFDDKNLSSVVERLDQEKHVRERLTLHDLVMIIGEDDYTLGMDISTIVNEQLGQKGGMTPERTATAAQDFGVPEIPEYDQQGVHHGDLGHEHDALDFIISEEEQGVIMQERDNIRIHLGNETDDSVALGDLVLEEDDDVAEYPEAVDPAVEEDEDELPRLEDGDIGMEVDEDDDAASDLTAESILALEEQLAATPIEEAPASEFENPPLTAIDELPDIVLGEEELRPTQQFLQSKDVIPDITLDEIEAIELSLEQDDIHTDSYRTTALDDLDVSDDGLAIDSADSELLEDAGEPDIPESTDADASVPDRREDTLDMDIDWEKEAEELDIDAIDAGVEKSLDALSSNEIAGGRADELQPAEDLLRDLDLDGDFGSQDSNQGPRQNISAFDPDNSRAASHAAMVETMEEEEPSPATEKIIQEYGDLRQLLPDSDKKKYVRKLFQKNDEAFTHALNVLNGKASWRQASEYIDELFMKFDVDMYSRLAVKFTDDIYKRYANRK